MNKFNIPTDEVTRDYVPNITDLKRRKALLLPWLPADFKHVSYQQAEPDPEFFGVCIWATKTNKMTMRSAKTQISLGICPVWSESSLYTQWVAKGPSFLHADSKDSNQTGQMPRLIWVFAGRTCHFVHFVMRQLIFGS